jgi:hypothetical protein
MLGLMDQHSVNINVNLDALLGGVAALAAMDDQFGCVGA